MENRTRTIPDPPVRRGAGRLLLDSVSETILNIAFFVLHFVGWGIRWTIATVFFLAVMAGAGYYVFMQALSGGQHVQVPNIVGMDLTRASLLLAEQGLEMGKPIPVAHDKFPKDYVLAQRPAPEKVVRAGRKVEPTVSMGADFLRAPNLLMKEWKVAEEEIVQSQFRLGRVARIPHTSPRDTVIGQDPPPDATIANQGEINLLLSGGDESNEYTFMPSIIGMSEEAAREALQGFEVRLEPVEVTREDVSPNVILSQDPLPDSDLDPGTTVRYEIRHLTEEEVVATYQGKVSYMAPADGQQHQVKVRITDRNGSPIEIKGAGGKVTDTFELGPGYRLSLPVKYAGSAKVEITDNGLTAATWYLRDGGEPVLKP